MLWTISLFEPTPGITLEQATRHLVSGQRGWRLASCREEGPASSTIRIAYIDEWCASPIHIGEVSDGSLTLPHSKFDEHIIARYAEYMTQAHWYHIGSYHLFGLPEYMYVDTLDVVEAANRAEALANDAAVPVTAEMQTIYDECDLFLD